VAYTVEQIAPHPFREVALRCPICKHRGIFVPIEPLKDTAFSANAVAGARKCPNPSCRALVFVVYTIQPGPNRVTNVLTSYPPERLDFDPSGIPSNILAAMEEALTCHANSAYSAAAMMVRKVLEELCEDQGAQGKDLYQRLQTLSTKIVVPQALLDAANDLRLLGNDAAHIEAKTFNQVSQDEVEAGIELARELLKAVYQMESLVARLKGLRKGEP